MKNSWIKEWAFRVFLVLLGISILFEPPSDYDFGWQYRLGEYTVTQGKVLKDNIYSVLMPEYKWANSYWLSQVVFYLLYSKLGEVPAGLILSGLISSITTYWIGKHTKSKSLQFLLQLIIMTGLSLFILTVRPMYFSVIMLIILISLLVSNKDKYIFLGIPILTVLWANLHADWVIGLFIYATFIFFKIVEYFSKRFGNFKLNPEISADATNNNKDIQSPSKNLGTTTPGTKPSYLFIHIFVWGIALLGSLINPFGFGLWETLMKETNPLQFSMIMEWLPILAQPNRDASIYYAFIIFKNVGLAALVILIFLRNEKFVNKYSSWYLLCFLFFYLISYRMTYFHRALFVFSIPLIAAAGNQLLPYFSEILSKRYDKALRALKGVFMIGCALVGLENLSITLEKTIPYHAWAKEIFPVDAIEYIRKTKPEGNIYHNFNHGGYIIWQLPEYKTFIDGRMPSWRTENFVPLEFYRKMYLNPEENKEEILKIFENYNINTFMDEKKTKITKFMYSQGWEEVYSDKKYVILTRPKPN